MGQGKVKLMVYTILLLILFFSLLSVIFGLSGKAFSLELFGFAFLLLLGLLGFLGYANGWGERMFFFFFLLYLLNLILIRLFLGSLYLVILVLAILGFLLSLPKVFSSNNRSKDIDGQQKDGQQKDKKIDHAMGASDMGAQINIAKTSVERSAKNISERSEPHSEVFDSEVGMTSNALDHIKGRTFQKKERKEFVHKLVSERGLSRRLEAAKLSKRKPFSKRKPEIKTLKQVIQPISKPVVKYDPGRYVASKNSNSYHLPTCDWAKKIHKHRLTWFQNKEDAWERGFKAHSCVTG
ncbi:hypothetical protein HYX12_00955 [Candidatus Woesearchaeota archaeon]|nr:hypothetical protein [Candidatus Woesearchaeota archaeon]